MTKLTTIADAINYIAALLNLSTGGAQWVYENTDCPRWDDPAFAAHDFLADPKTGDIPLCLTE